ncbi:PilW family protein [Rhodocyclaceae bacterium SMB388]
MKQSGLTLVELLVGMAVGLIVISGVTGAYLTVVRGSADTLRATRLNQEVRAVLEIMSNDIRRAGYCANCTADEKEAFMEGVGALSLTADCIIYTYDRNGNSTRNDDEFFGFKLEAKEPPEEGNRLLMRNANLGCDEDWTAASTATPPQSFVISDDNAVEFSNFALSTAGSLCYHLIAEGTAEHDDSPWSPEDALSAACQTPIDKGEVSINDKLIDIRQVSVRIDAHHVADPTQRTSLSEQLNVRNNRLFVQK